jgi:hypothetical protein
MQYYKINIVKMQYVKLVYYGTYDILVINIYKNAIKANYIYLLHLFV